MCTSFKDRLDRVREKIRYGILGFQNYYLYPGGSTVKKGNPSQISQEVYNKVVIQIDKARYCTKKLKKVALQVTVPESASPK